jgi:NAD(P)-dependent dehydrogenase (short-subunit alcohol dehydrogenase family)
MVPGSRQEEEAMSIPTSEDRAHGQELLGQTVVVIGGSSGIGLETARRARAEGASVVLAARDPEQLRSAGLEVGAFRTAALDANDADALERFFGDVPQPIGHVMVIAGGPVYGRLLDMDLEVARRGLLEHPLQMIMVARNAAAKMGPGGSLLSMGGTGGRAAAVGIAPTATAMLPPLTASLALELAPIRINLIAAGFVDTSLSASLLANGLEARREQLPTTLPIRRVVGPADVAALAVHLMSNTALTGATYDIDGGQQLVRA